FSQFTRNAWFTITVIEANGIVAGWAARESLDDTLSDFWVDPRYRRKGLGAALLRRVESDIVGQGFERAALQTHAANAEAIGFFQKHGYSVNWLSVVYAPKLDRDLPTVGMSKQLVDDDDGAYGPGF